MSALDLTLFETFAIRNNLSFWVTDSDKRSVERWYQLVSSAMTSEDTVYNPHDVSFTLAIISKLAREMISHFQTKSEGVLSFLNSIEVVVDAIRPGVGPTDASLALTAIAMLLKALENNQPFSAYPSADSYGYYETMFGIILTAWLLSQPGARIEGDEQQWYVVVPDVA